MIALIVFAVLVWIGLPLVAPLFWAAFAGLTASGNDAYIAAEALYRGLDNLPLSAIVGFVLAGGLMGPTGLTEELVDCARRLVGRASGGLAMVTILACLFFSCLSGSGGATCAAVGAIMIPSMLKEGYPKEYAGTMAATGGVLGILIPPSIPMIIYASQANVPSDRLFMAGIIPGLLLAALLMFVAWLDAKRRGLTAPAAADGADELPLWRLIWRAKFAVALPVIILGGIWGGHFTPTEAAVIAVFWALAVGIFRRKLTVSSIWGVLTDTALLAGGAVILLAPATALARYLAIIGAPQQLAVEVAALAGSPEVFLFIMAAALFLCGLFADTISMIAIMTPIFLPTAHLLGVDPTIMGLVFILCCEAGFLTPPFGGNLFIAARLSGSDLGRLSVAALPYVGVIMLLTAILIIFPKLALFIL
ncbi:TRAP transporter large permease [Deltaproteobacteria bacterium Smac51]|nr:TRAP transporter large permease [Deltaproteobacteria bacterium Smac51]